MKKILNYFVDVRCRFAKQTSINVKKVFDLSDSFIDLIYFRKVAKIFPKKSEKFQKSFAAAQRFTGIPLLALELNVLDFPKSVKMLPIYRFLEFDNRDRKIKCERLMSLENMEKGVLLNAHDSLKNEISLQKFQMKIEKLVMEKTVWETNVKKATSNTYLFNEPFLSFLTFTF